VDSKSVLSKSFSKIGLASGRIDGSFTLVLVSPAACDLIRMLIIRLNGKETLKAPTIQGSQLSTLASRLASESPINARKIDFLDTALIQSG
jgi:hypothetical protein